jgi:hypothetical protein
MQNNVTTPENATMKESQAVPATLNVDTETPPTLRRNTAVSTAQEQDERRCGSGNKLLDT